ncbi:hypothetical protein TrCOL_g10120 [Triparma columacea]|uniref:NADH kinase n=1 Tax=Triparma columacea TaxID=722753 RepID=A0A9W7G9E9_9STRA|nr:hypothetical protein TrCOL_g10120 [Triparma columacea]
MALSAPRFKNLLIVIKQTAFEEYSQLKLRGSAPKAVRWGRLESRYNKHKACVTDLISTLKSQHGDVNFNCVNRVDLDRQHLYDVDLVVAVGGDGTVLSCGHFLDNGSIPLVGINSDPSDIKEKKVDGKLDERRSHGALCMFTANNLADGVATVLRGGGTLSSRTRIQCTVKSAFSETRLVPALNDLLISHPVPASVSRFRMGWLTPLRENGMSSFSEMAAPIRDGGGDGLGKRIFEDANPNLFKPRENTTRYNNQIYEIKRSFNAWSSGLWISTATGSSAAMAAAGGRPMDIHSPQLQYLVREHLMEKNTPQDIQDRAQGMLNSKSNLHLRWNSQKGRIFIDGSHLLHNLDLGDEVIVNNQAPDLHLFMYDNDPRLHTKDIL